MAVKDFLIELPDNDTWDNLFPQYPNILNEDDDSINQSQLESMINTCIDNVADILFINKKNINKIIIYTEKDILGKVKPIGYMKYDLYINKVLLQSNKLNFLISAIYHELCHIHQVNIAFSQGIVFYDNGLRSFKLDEATKLITDNNGHPVVWQKVADKINTTLKPAVKIKNILSKDELNYIFDIEESFYLTEYLI